MNTQAIYIAETKVQRQTGHQRKQNFSMAPYSFRYILALAHWLPLNSYYYYYQLEMHKCRRLDPLASIGSLCCQAGELDWKVHSGGHGNTERRQQIEE